MSELADPPTGVAAEATLMRPTWVRWRIIALLMAFSFMSYFNRINMVVAGDERIMRVPEYAISPTQMGFVYSAFLFVYTLFMAPGGWLVDWIGPWAALLAIGLGSALFTSLTGLVGQTALAAGLGLLALIVIRGLVGLCSAPIYPACGRIAGRWVPARHRAAAIGLIIGSAPLGIASTYVVFSALIKWFDWPWAFVVSGAITAVLALAWGLYATDHPDGHSGVNPGELALILGDNSGTSPERPEAAGRAHSPAQDWRLLIENKSLVLLTISYAAVGYFEYLFFYWMHYYFIDVLKLDESRSQFYAGIPPLAMAVGMPLGGWVSDRVRERAGPRWGRAGVGAATMLASAACLFAGIYPRDPRWIVAWFALAMGTIGACDTVCWTTAFEIGGRRGGTAGGICNTGGNAGGLIAPILTPWVGVHFGWASALGLGSLICLLGVALWLWIDPSASLDQSPPEREGSLE
jgi:ACS family glucarate transporter-like MFS transporter